MGSGNQVSLKIIKTLFLEENNVDKWVEIITSISKNEKLLNEISSNSITTIKQFYDQNEFFNKIYQLI